MISFFLPSFDLPPDLERQLYSGRRHPLRNQSPDGLVDRRCSYGLAIGLAEPALSGVADIPSLWVFSRVTIVEAEMSSASAAHGASLQQCSAFPRRGASRQFVCSSIGLMQLEILLVLLPADITWVGVGYTSEPVAAVVLSLDYHLPFGVSAVAPATIRIG